MYVACLIKTIWNRRKQRNAVVPTSMHSKGGRALSSMSESGLSIDYAVSLLQSLV